MTEERTIQNRQVAYKVRIKDLINGRYIKKEGWNPSYILTDNGKQVNRVNLIATVVLKPEERDASYQSIILDDGTARISARVFEKKSYFDNISVGDIVLVIGRPREYGNEKYLLPEIIKKLQDKRWIKVRELELKNMKKSAENKTEQKEEMAEDIKEDPITSKIINLIREKDKGDGVDFDEILKQVNDEEAINSLLKKGEIFEIRHGRLKVLE